MDEAKLREKLAHIEVVFAGATTEGEHVASGEARRRIQMRLEAAERTEPAVEAQFSVAETWAQKLLVALLRRYGLKPYRKPGQRFTTIMVKAPKTFVHETIMPEYKQLSATLGAYVDEITERIIADVIHAEGHDAKPT